MTDRCKVVESIGDEQYILAAFPENYRLFEHRRFADPDNPDAKSDRRDVYLYGHPQGRKKRFRSPQDFLPHLLWLSTDPSGDPENCSCKLCTTDDALKAGEEMNALQRKLFGIKQEEEPEPTKAQGVAAQNKETSKEKSKPAVASKATNSVVKQPKAKVQEQAAKASKSASPVGSTAQAASQAQASTHAQAQSMAPTPPITLKSPEQILDAQPNKFVYRPGEIIWYQRSSGMEGAVGLGVITARELYRDERGQTRPMYAVQPLSHPYNHPARVVVYQEQNIKPWLAFSTPESFHPKLRGVVAPYDRINWRELLNGQVNEVDIEADGSMFAAKDVDMSYTPLEPISHENNNGSPETKYNGLFFGGEKFWAGEAIRLRPGKDIMIVSEIIEKHATATTAHDIQAYGDVYTYKTVAHNPNRQIPRNTYLPARVQQDLEFRNAASIRQRNQVSYWKLEEPRSRRSISEVKGRWYESRLMSPIVLGAAAFTQSVGVGDVRDVGESINSRGDSAGAPPKNGNRKPERLQALGRCVPAGTQLGGRVSFQPQQQQQQQQQPSEAVPMAPNAVGVNVNQGVPDTVMSEFVDVERMNEGN